MKAERCVSGNPTSSVSYLRIHSRFHIITDNSTLGVRLMSLVEQRGEEDYETEKNTQISPLFQWGLNLGLLAYKSVIKSLRH